MRAYLETLFRSPALLVLPVLLIPLVVAPGAFLSSHQYRVAATVWVEEGNGLLDDNRTPGAREAEAFRQRLETEAFRDTIIKEAGLTQTVEALAWPKTGGGPAWLAKVPFAGRIAQLLGGKRPEDVETARALASQEVFATLAVEEPGRNLVRVSYVGGDPEIGVRLVDAAIVVYKSESLSLAEQRAQQIVEFYEGELRARQREMEQARVALAAYEGKLPAGYSDSVASCFSESQELAALKRAHDDSIARYQEVQGNLDDAKHQAETDLIERANSLVVVDSPAIPGSRTLDLHGILTLTLLGVVLGSGMGAMLIVVRTWSDQRLRRPEDVESRLKVPVLGSLPRISKREQP